MANFEACESKFVQSSEKQQSTSLDPQALLSQWNQCRADSGNENARVIEGKTGNQSLVIPPCPYGSDGSAAKQMEPPASAHSQSPDQSWHTRTGAGESQDISPRGEDDDAGDYGHFSGGGNRWRQNESATNPGSSDNSSGTDQQVNAAPPATDNPTLSTPEPTSAAAASDNPSTNNPASTATAGDLAPPAGYTTSQMVANYNFVQDASSANGSGQVPGFTDGISNVQGYTAAWTGTAQPADTSLGANGITLAAAAAGTSLTSDQTVGGNGQPIDIQWTQQSGPDWSALWMLPQGTQILGSNGQSVGSAGSTELDLNESNFTNGSSNGADNVASHFHEEDGTTVGNVGTTNANLDNSMNTYNAYITANQMVVSVNGQVENVVPLNQNLLYTPMELLVDNAIQQSNTGWIANPASGAAQATFGDIQVYQGAPSSS